MDSGKGKTKKYSFKDPKIDELMSMIPEIECHADFRKKYGSLIPLMKLKKKEGIISTLVQFFDPLHHCFTFPDYQLMPTLEEFSKLLRIPIINQLPFNGTERDPKPEEIA